MSTARRDSAVKQNKRASIIVPARPSLDQQRPSQTSIPSTSPSRRESIATSSQFVSTESDYLTALAAQERRVLELKDELSKAEAQLQKLKKQWANHESARRRDERQRQHQMRPIAPVSPKVVHDGDEDGTNAWMYEEMARRKALLSNTKTSHRRVFSGSRHTKALSLLEEMQGEAGEGPEDSGDTPTLAPRHPLQASPRVAAESRRSRELLKNGAGPPRASTTPNLWQTGDFAIDPMSWARADSRSPQREAILKTGKQVASDLREGLWTFLEDLRQVAIGDEVRPAPSPPVDGARREGKRSVRGDRPTRVSRRGSGGSLRKGINTSPVEDSGESFLHDHNLPAASLIEAPAVVRTPTKRKAGNIPTKKKAATKALPTTDPPDLLDTDNSWETWDSPLQPSKSHLRSPTASSDASPNASTSSVNSTPNTDTCSTDSHRDSNDSTPKVSSKRDAIPWPSLGPSSSTVTTESSGGLGLDVVGNMSGAALAVGGQLRRTASHLMQEWERSLSVSPVNGDEGGRLRIPGQGESYAERGVKMD
jgi:hypothetical protein